jgi:hypothetical protein
MRCPHCGKSTGWRLWTHALSRFVWEETTNSDDEECAIPIVECSEEMLAWLRTDSLPNFDTCTRCGEAIS